MQNLPSPLDQCWEATEGWMIKAVLPWSNSINGQASVKLVCFN